MKAWFEYLRPYCTPRLLNHFAATWFTLTITGVFYHGISHILPVVYEGYPDWVFTFHYFVIAIMFEEVMLNYALVKFVKSPFVPEKFPDTPSADQMESEAVEVRTNSLDLTSDNHYNLNKIKQNANFEKQYKRGTIYMATHNLQQGGAAWTNGDAPPTDYRTLYPYFSWKPCIICQKPRPPRTHHCPLCGMCVLKRDHHCFFAGTCIGLRNQRFFAVFAVWTSIATTYCFIHSTIYLFTYFIPHTSYIDVIFPFTFIRWILGYTEVKFVVLLLLYYSVIWFWLTCVAFVHDQFMCILQGVTSFERDNNIKVVNTGDKKQKLEAVFGKYWWANFIIPLHFIFPSADDGVHWPLIKM